MSIFRIYANQIRVAGTSCGSRVFYFMYFTNSLLPFFYGSPGNVSPGFAGRRKSNGRVTKSCHIVGLHFHHRVSHRACWGGLTQPEEFVVEGRRLHIVSLLPRFRLASRDIDAHFHRCDLAQQNNAGLARKGLALVPRQDFRLVGFVQQHA